MSGFSVKINHIREKVWVKGKEKTLLEDLSLTIEKGEFVAIVGSSGAGKTTLMNILGGYNKPYRGNVYFNGLDIHKEDEYFKGKVAYVPQEEILDQTLTLEKSLEYSLKLRVKNLKRNERKTIIDQVLNTLELSGSRNTLIKNLSGGEKKRASIATEMLSDPNLYLLDEPTSGLDANIEKKIMLKLREIANSGKTIIITAHTVSNLNLCDKIIFMGSQGRICYYGTYKDIFKYFNVKEFVEIYDILKEDSLTWYKKYLADYVNVKVKKEPKEKDYEQVGFFSQTKTLVSRYLRSLYNNKMMLVLLLGQALLMAFMLCIATDEKSFLNPVMASTFCVAFTLASMWLGLFNTIQEIVKERDMLKKEYMSGLNFASYMTSKVIIIALLSLYQSVVCASIVYAHLNPRPEVGLLFQVLPELIMNFFLLTFTMGIIGLFISSVVKHTKTTLIIAPLFMMVQMLFSGMFIPFVTFTKRISYITLGRWGFESFGTICNLISYGVSEPLDKFFMFSNRHLISVWVIFIIMAILFFLFTILAINFKILSRERKVSVFRRG